MEFLFTIKHDSLEGEVPFPGISSERKWSKVEESEFWRVLFLVIPHPDKNGDFKRVMIINYSTEIGNVLNELSLET